MAWHLSGNWDGAPQEDLGQILLELTWAINERIDIGNQLWKTPVSHMTITTQNGAKEWPVIADFSGMESQAIIDGTQLDELQDGLTAMLPLQWYPSTYQSSTTVYSLSSLRTAAGYDDAWLTRDTQEDVTPFLQLKDMLDLVFRNGVVILPHITVWWDTTPIWTTVLSDGKNSGAEPPPPFTMPVIWAQMIADGIGPETWLTYGPGYWATPDSRSPTREALAITDYGGTMNLSGFTFGSILGTRFLITEATSANATNDPTVTHDWGSFTLSTAPVDFFRADWPVAVGPASVNFEITPPVVYPFTVVPPFTIGGGTFAQTSAWAFFDIRTAVTYG